MESSTHENLARVNQVLTIPQSFWDQFSPQFHVTLTLYVIESIQEGQLSKQQITAMVDQEIWDKTLVATGVTPDKPISAEKLWQEILQNLHKDLDTRSHISLTSNQVEVLRKGIEAVREETSGKEKHDSKAGQSENAVLFTCGHHFVKERFTGTVLSHFEERLRPDLPQSAALLNAYYRRKDLYPMACPSCVLQAVQAM